MRESQFIVGRAFAFSFFYVFMVIGFFSLVAMCGNCSRSNRNEIDRIEAADNMNLIPTRTKMPLRKITTQQQIAEYSSTTSGFLVFGTGILTSEEKQVSINYVVFAFARKEGEPYQIFKANIQCLMVQVGSVPTVEFVGMSAYMDEQHSYRNAGWLQKDLYNDCPRGSYYRAVITIPENNFKVDLNDPVSESSVE